MFAFSLEWYLEEHRRTNHCFYGLSDSETISLCDQWLESKVLHFFSPFAGTTGRVWAPMACHDHTVGTTFQLSPSRAVGGVLRLKWHANTREVQSGLWVFRQAAENICDIALDYDFEINKIYCGKFTQREDLRVPRRKRHHCWC